LLDAAGLYPQLKECTNRDFFEYYSTNSQTKTAQALYTDGGGVRRAFEEHWAHVAEALADEPAVLALELMNEPWPGDTNDPGNYSLFMSWWFNSPAAERDLLLPFYRHVVAAIRAVNKRHIVAYEPVMWDVWSSGFLGERLEPDEPDESREAFSWHSYCWWAPNVTPHLSFLCAIYHRHLFAVQDFSAKQQRSGSLLSEYGSLGSTGADCADRHGSACLAEIARAGTVADEFLVSRFYWQYKNFEDHTSSGGGFSLYPKDGLLAEEKLRVIATPFAQAVAGRPLLMVWSAGWRVMVLEYEAADADSDEGRTTEVHLAAPLHFPDGFAVLVSRLEPREYLDQTAAAAGAASGARRLAAEEAAPGAADAPASLGHIEQVGSSRLRIRHPRGVAGQRLLVCVVPCDDYHKEFCPGGVSAEGGDAAVWLSLWHPCIWRSRAQTVYVVLCSAVMTTLAMTAVSLLQIRRHSRTTQQPLAGGHLPRSYRLLLATAASVQLVGALAATGCPYNDDPWRWAAFVGIGPFLLAYVSLATGAQGPMICAILGIFAILWRATWCLHYMVGVDSVLKLAAIRLLVFLLAAGLLIEVLVSLPKRSYYALFKLLATRPDATTPPTPRGATGRRVILAFLAFTLTLAFCSAVAAGLTGIIVLLVDPVPAILVPFVTTAGFIGFVVGLPIGGYLAHYIVRRSGRAEAEEEEDSSSWSAGPLSRPRGFSILLW